MSFDSKEDCNGKEAIQEIVAKLRQVEVLISQWQTMADAIRQIGVSEVTAGSLVGLKTVAGEATKGP